MCYCKSNVRTPFCSDCSQTMWEDIIKLKEEIAKYDKEKAKLRKFALWCISRKFDSRNLSVFASEALKKEKLTKK